MRYRIIVVMFAVLAAVAGGAFAAETEVFGIKEGMTEAQLRAVCDGVQLVEAGKFKFFEVKPKKSNPAIHTVYVAVTPEYGVQKVVCTTEAKNHTGDAAMRLFENIMTALVSKYGKADGADFSAETLSDLLYHDDKRVKAHWFKNGLFILAELEATRRKWTYVRITYEMSKWSKFMHEASKVEATGL